MITGMLKAKLASEVIRLNYIQSYILSEQQIKKAEKKLIFISTTEHEKLKSFLQKNYPETLILPNNLQ
ncbi:MAG: hypothetical protein LBH96_01190 [Candidatus Peribacteria bacterium]|jgi:hypothetical protein|nr:hypothetical protein [Candidatus Peribacteria bacterium]